MAWTGTPTTKLLGRYIARITGAVLAGNASATIGLPGDSGADLQLPAGFPTTPDTPGLLMSDLVVTMAAEAAAPGGTPTHFHVTQADGPFRVTVTNDTGNALTFEFFVQYLHSMIR